MGHVLINKMDHSQHDEDADHHAEEEYTSVHVSGDHREEKCEKTEGDQGIQYHEKVYAGEAFVQKFVHDEHDNDDA